MAARLEQFVSNNPEFAFWKDPSKDLKEKVYTQAATHLVRDELSELLKKKRPFETDEYQQYREENRRHLTTEPVYKFEQGLVKCLQKTSFDFSSLPKNLQDNINFNEYRISNSKVNLDRWINEVLIPVSELDANAITVDLPINPDNPYTPIINSVDEGGIDSAVELTVKLKIYYYDQWFHVEGEDILVLKEEGYPFGLDKEPTNYFFVADEEDWYIYYPSAKGKDGELIYTLELWYNHGYGSLPFCNVPAITALSKDRLHYRESFIRPYYEFADEFQSRFQDDQVVQTRYSYPREITDAAPCKDCHGKGFQVREHPVNKANHINVHCRTCEGTGYLVASTIQGRIIRPQSITGKSNEKEPINFISPDVSILEHTTPNAMFFLNQGRIFLGQQALLDIPESGEAKKVREQNKVELFLNYSIAVINWKEKHLNIRLSLISIDPVSADNRVRLSLPSSIAVKGEDALKEEVNNSLPVDRFNTIVKYIQEKYSNDPVTQRVHYLALLYAPLLAFKESEIASRVGEIGPYRTIDIIKADRAVYIFSNLTKEPEFKEPGKELELFEKADKLLSVFINT